MQLPIMYVDVGRYPMILLTMYAQIVLSILEIQ
jgi:hypothetical protein